MGSYQKALKIYEEIYRMEPDNLECMQAVHCAITKIGLRFLTQLCKDLNLPYDEYAAQLSKKEREFESRSEYNNADLAMINNNQGENQYDNQNVNINVHARYEAFAISYTQAASAADQSAGADPQGPGCQRVGQHQRRAAASLRVAAVYKATYKSRYIRLDS